MLALMLLTAAPLQAGTPPIAGPNGGQLQIVDVAEPGGHTQVLALEFVGASKAFHVYGVDSQGTLALQSSVPAQLGVVDAFAIEGTHIACRDSLGAIRLLEAAGTTWVQGPLLRTDSVAGGTYRDFGAADIQGDRIAHSLYGSDVLTIQDLSTPGTVALEVVIPLSPDSRVIDLALDGDLLVVVHGEFDAATSGYINQRAAVHEYLLPFGWTTFAPPLQPPAGVDWSEGPIDVDVSAGRLAVAIGTCGETYIYERLSNGSFGVGDVVTSNRQLAWSAGECIGLTKVALRGDDLVMTTGGDLAGERFERTPIGWEAREIVRSDLGVIGGYEFAGDYLISNSGSGGVQTHARIDNPTGWEITCPSISTVEPHYLFSTTPGTFALTEVALYTGPTSIFDIDFLIFGYQAGLRPLGLESQLCVGGPIRIVLIEDGGAIGTGKFRFDPVVAGVAPGSTVHFQGWQRSFGLPAGRTSNAIAVTFAP